VRLCNWVEVAISHVVPLNGGDMSITEVLTEGLRARFPSIALQMRTTQATAAPNYYPGEEWLPSLELFARPTHPIPKLWRLQEQVTYGRVLSRGEAALSDPGRAAIERLLSACAVVATGGTYLVEQYSLLPKLVEWEIAARNRLPVLFYTQSLGPFHSRINRKAVSRVLAGSPLILLRDDRSREHLKDLGVPLENVRVAADAAFAKAPERPKFALPAAGGHLHLGVSVRQWPVGAGLRSRPVRRFAAKLGEALTQLVRKLPADVTFISTCQGSPEYWIDDSLLALAVAADLPQDVRRRVEVDSSFHTPGEFRAIVATFDVYVATRLHAAILGLTAGTPVVPIAYEFKTHEVFRELTGKGSALDIHEFNAQDLVDHVDTLLRDADRTFPALEDGLARQRASAHDAQRLLEERLLSVL
jgi:colanic acid/amylovoran biosynthesis protein